MNKRFLPIRTFVLFLAALFTTSLAFAQPDSDFRTVPEKDQVILDDLIVDGSLCVGFDCVNGESFGFDTIRLKENNLRIRAMDTSSTASFPTRDWQITFNDTSNGGANKFSIDDIDGGRTPFTIEGNAPSHSLYVDDGGRLGFGTATPVADLHVKTGNTPTLRLEQDGSSGFTPQTWDVAGNEANFFIRDATNGSTLPFRIQPGASSNVIYIASDDEVGLGTTTPDEKLHVSGGNLRVEQTTNGADVSATYFSPDGGGSAKSGFVGLDPDQNVLVLAKGGADLGSSKQTGMDANGNFAVNYKTTGFAAVLDHTFEVNRINTGNFNFIAGSEMDGGELMFTATSSRKYKKNIENYERPDILERIAKVPVTTYNWNTPSSNEETQDNSNVLGLIAEDFHTVLERGVDSKINGNEVLMSLWMAVQDLNIRDKQYESVIAEKDQRIQALEDQVATILKRMDEINVSDVELFNNLETGYLEQNIPNPFDGQTQIKYFVPEKTNTASLRIMNVNGQLLRDVEIQSSGKGVINLQASDLPQGTYTYSLVIDGAVVATNKMILAK